MHAVDRMAFLKRHGIGLAPLILMFFLVTLLRSIRADFAPEIWIGLEVSAVPSTFSNSEIWVALGVITVNGTMVMISDNRRAFLAALTVCALGISLLATALMAYHAHIISGFTFMVMIGLGLYIPYVAVHTTIFERLLAMTRDRGNLGFLMCLADSMGYLGYVVVLLARQLWSAEVNFVVWLSVLCWITIGLSFACLIVSWRHFTIGYAKDARRDSMADATTQGLI